MAKDGLILMEDSRLVNWELHLGGMRQTQVQRKEHHGYEPEEEGTEEWWRTNNAKANFIQCLNQLKISPG
jgi:hypothetical protein